MLQPGHIAGGYLATKAILDIAHLSLSTHEYGIAMTVGLVASVIPDLDLVYHFAKKKAGILPEESSHRELASHAPLLWLAFGLILYFASATDMWRAISLAFIAGSWSHFVLDTVEYGIMWLWPFHKRIFVGRTVAQPQPKESSILRYYWRWFWEVYTRNFTFWLEVAIVIAAIIVYIR